MELIFIRIVEFVVFTIIAIWAMVWLIPNIIRSAKTPSIKAEVAQEFQAEKTEFKKIINYKETEIEELKQKIAFHEERDKSFSSRWQQLIDRERKVEERERLAEGLADSLVAERKRELERRERNLEDTVAHKVAEGIKGREIGLNDCFKIIKRKFRTIYKREQEMYKRAVLIADHLGVPLKCILNRKEKKLVDQLANELAGEHCALTEEHYALIDLVMSCPEDQLKDMLASMQRFDQSWPGSPPPPPESEN